MATDLLAARSASAKALAADVELPVGAFAGEGFSAPEIKPAAADTAETSRATKTLSQSDTRSGGATIVRDWVELTKPRIVTMILITTAATAVIGAGAMVEFWTLVGLLLGTGLVAGSAGAANQVWERLIDRNMTRTAGRPLPSGRMSVMAASLFTGVTGIVGTAMLWQWYSVASAAAGAATWLLYVLLYTPMKTRTAWNTTIGAIAGALPMLIGYTATGGRLSDASGWLLVGLLVAWQYPHFMAIAWLYRKQYHEAGFKMSTTVEPTGRSAAAQSIIGSVALIGCGIALCFGPGASWTAWLGSCLTILATYPMLRASIRFAANRDDIRARKLLRSSLLVLPTVLLIVTLRVFW